MAEGGQAATSKDGPEVEVEESGSSKDKMQISDLPSNVFRLIFARLDLAAKGKAVQVCKKWRDVGYEKELWQNERAFLNLGAIANRRVYASLERRGVQRIKADITSLCWQTRLRILLRNVSSLLELNVQSLYALDKHLNILYKFPNLRKLELHHCHKVTDETLKVVGRSLRELTILVLSRICKITDEGIAFLTGSDETAGHVRGCLKLQELILYKCCRISDESLRMIAINLPQLVRLCLRCCSRITDAGIEHITGSSRLANIPGNRKLEHLDLLNIGDVFTDDSFRMIAGDLKALDALLINGNNTWTELAFSYIGSMTSLRVLNMNDCTLKGEWLAHLVDTKIDTLNLKRGKILGAEGFRHLSRMSHLKELEITDSTVKDEDIEHLSQSSSKIETLKLRGNMRITDVGLDHLSKMVDHLTRLDLRECKRITAGGLLRLAELGSTKLKLTLGYNFLRHSEAVYENVRTIEANKMGSDVWVGAARKMMEIESLLQLAQEEQLPAE